MVSGIVKDLVDRYKEPPVVNKHEYFIDATAAVQLHKGRGKRPRLRHFFFARFVPDTHGNIDNITRMIAHQAGFGFKGENIRSDSDVSLYSRITNISGPSITPQIQKINQYNRPRIVQTGIEYGDVTLNWRDTVDGIANDFWKLYYSFYYRQAKPDNLLKNEPNPDTGFNDNSLNHNMFDEYGIDLRHKGGQQNFFRRIEVYQMYGGSFTRFDLINPYISNYTHTDLAVEDGSIGVHAMTIAYEKIDYVIHEKRIRNEDTGNLDILLEDFLDEEVQGRLPDYSENQIKSILKAFDDITGLNASGTAETIVNAVDDPLTFIGDLTGIDLRSSFDPVHVASEATGIDVRGVLGANRADDISGKVINSTLGRLGLL